MRITLEVTIEEDPANKSVLGRQQVVEDLKNRLEMMRRVGGFNLNGTPVGGFTVTNVREV